MGGVIGTILLGVFASPQFNPSSSKGLLEGGVKFFLTQTGAVLICSLFSFVVSYALLSLINSFNSIKIPQKIEDDCLDQKEHKEVAYDYS